jgi:hypothetical protein
MCGCVDLLVSLLNDNAAYFITFQGLGFLYQKSIQLVASASLPASILDFGF